MACDHFAGECLLKNGQAIGKEYLQQLESYLASGASLPISGADGSLNLTELARATGIPKSTFYQNPSVRDRLEVARLERGVVRRGAPQSALAKDSTPAKPDGATASHAALERKAHRLEQTNAVLTAENFELRRAVKALQLQLGREDMMLETGRRVAVPPSER